MRWVAMNISVTVMLAASDVSFSMAISELDSGGKAVRMAWGSTMRRNGLAIGHAHTVRRPPAGPQAPIPAQPGSSRRRKRLR